MNILSSIRHLCGNYVTIMRKARFVRPKVFQKQSGSYAFEYQEQPVYGNSMVNTLIFSPNEK